MGMFGDEEGDSGDKTEGPTGKRAGHARSQGMVGQSTELSQVIGMTAAFHALCYITPWLWQDIINLVKGAFSSEYFHEAFTLPILRTHFYGILFLVLPKLFLILSIAAFFGAGATAVQTNFLFSWTLIKPKMKSISPLAGLKRIFSVGNVVNMGKHLLKLAIIGPIAYSAYFTFVPAFLGMMDIPISQMLPMTANMASTVFARIMKWLLVLAIADLIWQKWRTKKKLMMSKQEHKDERKATDGDEGSRKRILAIGLQRARDRMLKNVAKADVVVTNPTHIAVALSYSAVPGSAPRVVAKGKDHLAERIKDIARKHGIPVVERKPLARALFATVEVDKEIPYELFKAVAEILAYVYRLKGKTMVKKRSNAGNQQISRK
jgi:flagellar biosynthetic protein FlhB